VVEGEDHLAALLLTGDGESGGVYTPERTTLTLRGKDDATHHVVYLHEVHHSGLNDSTAWGAALHVLAALPSPHRDDFRPLLDVCRLPHEAFATFAGISVASAVHQAVAKTLVQYPMYEPLYRLLADRTDGIGGPQRRYLAVTALARVCMQTPVLDVLLDRADLRVKPSDLRAIDTPNGRWRFLIRQQRDLLELAASEADDIVVQTLGDPPLVADVDGADASAVVVNAFDAAWELWETAVYERLADALRTAGATPLAFNGHMTPTSEALLRAREIVPGLALHAARIDKPAQDDRALSASAIQRMRLTLPVQRYPAKLIRVDTEELVRIVDQHMRIADQPALVVSTRLPRRLEASYAWDADDLATLTDALAPVVAARLIEVDETTTILHAVIDAPAELRGVLTRWGDRGPAIVIEGASCLLDRSWQRTWFDASRAADAFIYLIDSEIDRFTRSWIEHGATVHTGVIHIDDTSGAYWANAIRIGDEPTLWLHVADEITVKLMLDQLRRTPGLTIEDGTDHLRAWTEVLPIAVTHVLATESFLDLEAIDAETLARHIRDVDSSE
jgi:hypothetical protein